jgi:hypothetical protein
MDHDLKQTKNLKLLLTVFEELSSQKINFHKNKIFCYDNAKELKGPIYLFRCN